MFQLIAILCDFFYLTFFDRVFIKLFCMYIIFEEIFLIHL
jgi:hypothetical protein